MWVSKHQWIPQWKQRFDYQSPRVEQQEQGQDETNILFLIIRYLFESVCIVEHHCNEAHVLQISHD